MRDLKHKSAKLALRLAVAIIACGLVVLLTVPLFGACWHLLFGDTISYAGWNITVPKGFFVRESRDGPTMWKLNFGIPLLAVPYGHISLFSRPGEPFLFSQHYRRFAASVSQDAETGGYRVQERTLAAGGSSAYCLQMERQAAQPNSLVRCAIEGTRIAVFCEGDRKYLPDFYSVLENMSPMRDGTNSKH